MVKLLIGETKTKETEQKNRETSGNNGNALKGGKKNMNTTKLPIPKKYENIFN